MATTTQTTATSKTEVSGIVRIENRGDFPCRNFLNLSVKVFQVNLSAEKLLQTMTVDEYGMFTGTITAEKSTTLFARLYYTTAETRKKSVLVAETGPHCPKNGYVTIGFDYEPSKYGDSKYAIVTSLVLPQLGKVKLADLSIKQREQIQCIACVSDKVLNRLINANRLLGSLQTSVRSCTQKIEAAMKQKSPDSEFLKKSLENIQLLQTSDRIESILFALIKIDFNQELHQLLTISTAQLTQKIHEAVSDNTIAPISNESSIISGLIVLRNCLLFNSNYDDYFYDAKLINLSSLDMNLKNNLLDRTIEAGSLLGVLGADAVQTTLLSPTI